MLVVMAVVVVERVRRGKRRRNWHWRGRLRCFDRVGSRRGRSQLRILTVMVVAVFYAGPVIIASRVPEGRCRVALWWSAFPASFPW
jgi:hypothetical protein